MPFPFAAVFGGIGAAASIFGGIKGSQDAAANNDFMREQAAKQQRLLDEQARLQNDFNARNHEATIENWHKLANYNFETAMEKWQYDKTLRSMQFRADAQKYLMNVQNSNQQLTFNDIALQQGQEREQLALNETVAADRFERQDLLVQQLQATGKARLGQAGKSLNKRVQSIEAQVGRDLAVLDASLTGEIKASNLRMFDISLGKYAADARVEAARMLRPSRLPDTPAPTMPPEPTWVEPMKVLPGMAAMPAPQSTFAPLISGISSAAGSLASIDWSAPKSGGTITKEKYGPGF
jgi:hypothetical protein